MISQFQTALDKVKKEKDATGVSEYEKIVYKYDEPKCALKTTSIIDVFSLIDLTAANIANDTNKTFKDINAGVEPYKSTTNKDLYVFVYNTNITMMAHADNKLMIGVNYRDKTDVTGKKFRNLIVEGAIKKGEGSEQYVYINPAYGGLYFKTTYYKLVNGSDGNSYVVCAGNYKLC